MRFFSLSRATGLTLSAFVAAAFCAMMFVSHDADAARLGGGKSFGKQSSGVTQRQSTPPTAPAQNAAPPSQPSPAGAPVPQPAGNRWLGPLLGIGAGLGIGALLSHFGMGGAFGDGFGGILVIGLLLVGGVFIWRALQRSVASSAPPRPATAGYAPPLPQSSGPADEVNAYGVPLGGVKTAPAQLNVPWGVPADFDTAGFLRVAKVNYIRLQAAWDEKNLADIREFTTPEVFAEIRMQFDEEKGAVNKTEVLDLDASLLGIETIPDGYLASVRFSGSMRENGGVAAPFEEVWNLSKPSQGRDGWLLAGIQQVQ